MTRTCAALLVVPALALGCGGDKPTAPTPRTFVGEGGAESTIRAHAAACVGFVQEAPGEASASASLSGIGGGPVPIEMGTGGCAGTRSVVARGDRGAVTATLPVGDSFVRFENTSDRDAPYRLTIRFLRLY
jgi:hypothetical protein